MRISAETEAKSRKIRRWQTSIDAISGLMVVFLQLIAVNAGGLRLKRGQGILHLSALSSKLLHAIFVLGIHA